ncbi:putative zinc ribbon domain protein [Phycisphaerae bacterium RAS1]|nr:putative zinc ribbon domain protein [Phycisphaerae bacterium RAS1]
MGAALDALLRLQDLELQIADIRRQLARRTRIVAEQARKVETLRSSVEHEREQLRRSQVQVDELDLDLKSRSTHIAKLREQLNSVKTNKEYAAVLSQLNTEKADSTRVETRALEMMSGIETQRRSMADREKAIEAEVARLSDLQAQADQAQKLFAERLAGLQTRRVEAAAQVEPAQLVIFERLAERHDGEAIAAVERIHPRRDEFICGGCNMGLTTEVANALLTRNDVITCKNCGRILNMIRGS